MKLPKLSTKLAQAAGWRGKEKTGEGNIGRSKQIKESTRIFVAKVNEV
ncbi:MAG TPA: hypothetical protein VGK47_04830 [Nitrososphaeraceae archaeon]